MNFLQPPRHRQRMRARDDDEEEEEEEVDMDGVSAISVIIIHFITSIIKNIRISDIFVY